MNTEVQFDPGAGRHAGWQVFEAASGLCVEEGPWGPGGAITVPLPEADGDYRVATSADDRLD